MRANRFKTTIIACVGGLIFVLLLLSQIAAQMVDTEAALQPLRQYVKELTGQPLITERISVGLLTGPKVTINGVAIRNVTEAKKPYLFIANQMTIHLSLSDLFFSDNPKVDRITLSGLDVYLERDKEGRCNWDFLSRMKEQVSTHDGISVEIKGGSFTYTNLQNDFSMNIEQVYGSLGVGRDALGIQMQASMMQKPVYANGQCSIARFGHLNSFDTDCSGELSGEGLKLNVKERLVMHEENGMQTRGTITMDTQDIRVWGDAFFSQRKQSLQQYIKQPLAVRATAETYSDQARSINNITEFVAGNTSGKASFTKQHIDDRPQLDVKAAFSVIDFDEIKTLVRESAGTNDDIFAIEGGFDDQRTGSISISANEVMYNHLPVRDFRLKGGFGAGEIAISEARGELPGKGNFVTLGRVAGTPRGIQYEGLIEASGESLSALAPMVDIEATPEIQQAFTNYRSRLNVTVSPVSTIISELRVITGDHIRVAGGLNIYNDESRKVTGTLGIENFDFTTFETAWLGGASIHMSPAELPQDNPFAFRWLTDFDRDLSIQLQLQNFKIWEFEGDDSLVQFSASEGRFAFDKLDLNLGTTRVNGSMEVERTSKMDRPFVTSQLSVSKANLGNAVRETLWQSDSSSAATDNSVWSKESFNFNLLRHFDGHAEWRVGTLNHEKFSANSMRLVMDLKDAVLDMKEWRTTIWDGTLSGSFTLDVRTLPHFETKFKLENNNVKRFLESWVDFTNLNGLMSLSGDVKSSGVNFSNWIRNMTGALSFETRNLIAQDFNLPAVIRSISSLRAVSGLTNAVRLAFDSGASRFNSASGVLTLQNGYLDTTQINLRSNESIGRLEGRIDLRQWAMQMSLKLGLVSLAPNNYPNLVMNFAGPLNAPERSLDLKSIESFLAQKLR